MNEIYVKQLNGFFGKTIFSFFFKALINKFYLLINLFIMYFAKCFVSLFFFLKLIHNFLVFYFLNFVFHSAFSEEPSFRLNRGSSSEWKFWNLSYQLMSQLHLKFQPFLSFQ